ncbi:MAG: CHRD domain-containing protein, partial [Flavobacteriaceae bacterium]
TLKANLGDKFNFTTSLKGSNEVPAAITKAAGHVSVKISKDEQSIYYKITAANIDDVRASHFHLAPTGVNGPVVVTLYSNPVQPSGPQNGVLAEGVVTAANVTGTLAGDLVSLISAIRTGNIYVNVHTSNYPGGELRGQLAD